MTLLWTAADQYRAIRRSVFIAPGIGNTPHLRLLGNLTNRTTMDVIGDFSRDAFNGDEFADKLIGFLHQQKTHAHPDAWERAARSIDLMREYAYAKRRTDVQRAGTRERNAKLNPTERKAWDDLARQEQLIRMGENKLTQAMNKKIKLERAIDDLKLEHGLNENTIERLNRLKLKQEQSRRDRVRSLSPKQTRQ